MRLSLAAFAFLLVAAACSDRTHPDEVVGTWVSDSLWPGGLMRVIDTLELKPDGTGRGHSLVDSYLTSIRREGAVDTTHADRGSASFQWEVVRNEDGRHLCLSDRGKRQCATLRVVPGTEMDLGTTAYTMAIGQ